MKQLGLIGGVGPESTVDYYKGIIAETRKRLQTEHFPPLMINSIDMTAMLKLVAARDWDALVELLAGEIHRLKNAGAELAAICSNTPHVVIEGLRSAAPLPLVSILDATCAYAKGQGYRRVFVLGTLFTMQNGLYTEPMRQRGIEAFVPDDAGQRAIQDCIFPELEDGIIVPEKKRRMLEIAAEGIRRHNCDALVLGCTELPMMVKPGEVGVPLINTTEAHLQSIVDAMLA